MKWIRFFGVFLLSLSGLFAERGIVVCANNAYAHYLWSEINLIRGEYECSLPIEVWHAGNELSSVWIERFNGVEGVFVQDLLDYEGRPAKFYRGWQIKPFALFHSEFDEVLLIDADLSFFANPEKLFSQEGYLETGAFFFRDRTAFRVPFSMAKIHNAYARQRGDIASYLRTREFVQGVVSYPSRYVPDDWLHLWEDWIPDDSCWVSTEQVEAGCVLIDKNRHKRGVEEIYRLNEKYPSTYSYVYGDKETYWLGLERAKEGYALNDSIAYSLFHKDQWGADIVQFLEGELFYQQKWVPCINPGSYFTDFDGGARPLTEGEMTQYRRVFARQGGKG